MGRQEMNCCFDTHVLRMHVFMTLFQDFMNSLYISLTDKNTTTTGQLTDINLRLKMLISSSKMDTKDICLVLLFMVVCILTEQDEDECCLIVQI